MYNKIYCLTIVRCTQVVSNTFTLSCNPSPEFSSSCKTKTLNPLTSTPFPSLPRSLLCFLLFYFSFFFLCFKNNNDNNRQEQGALDGIENSSEICGR